MPLLPNCRWRIVNINFILIDFLPLSSDGGDGALAWECAILPSSNKTNRLWKRKRINSQYLFLISELIYWFFNVCFLVFSFRICRFISSAIWSSFHFSWTVYNDVGIQPASINDNFVRFLHGERVNFTCGWPDSDIGPIEPVNIEEFQTSVSGNSEFSKSVLFYSSFVLLLTNIFSSK